MGRFTQARQVKLRMDVIRPILHPSSSSSSSSSRLHRGNGEESITSLLPSLSFTLEQDDNNNNNNEDENDSQVNPSQPLLTTSQIDPSPNHNQEDSDEDLFSPEESYIPPFRSDGFSANPSTTSTTYRKTNDDDGDEDSEDDSNDEDEDGGRQHDWYVLAENELACEGEDSQELDNRIETALTDQEDVLKAKITSKSGNPLAEAKSRMHLGSFYQQAGRFADATTEYRKVQNLVGLAPRHEELYHASSRSLGVSLRASGKLDESVEILNKDVDVIVYRRSRSAGNEFNDYYDAELCRSCEELGNSWMTYVLIILILINHSHQSFSSTIIIIIIIIEYLFSDE